MVATAINPSNPSRHVSSCVVCPRPVPFMILFYLIPSHPRKDTEYCWISTVRFPTTSVQEAPTTAGWKKKNGSGGGSKRCRKKSLETQPYSVSDSEPCSVQGKSLQPNTFRRLPGKLVGNSTILGVRLRENSLETQPYSVSDFGRTCWKSNRTL